MQLKQQSSPFDASTGELNAALKDEKPAPVGAERTF
jgi:hypothetical protein